VAAYFDGSVPGRLARDRVPGAVVSVVSGGRTVFANGYGGLSASRSLMRIASITKLFTFTAVMQQVEAGRLDLDADVNRYLTAFKVPATYPRPVTLRDLMDHTAGFEDQIIGTGARAAADVPPLGEYLAAHMPARIRPPGEVSGYSNYGAALAGYIVSQVTGEPWDQYVQHHILDPLGMAHTTATEPVPAALAGDLAPSYNTDVTPSRRVPFEFDRLTPDGAVSTTAGDMARFMDAHLHPGTILSPATTALMHERSFAADPRLNGYAHGFMERTINGHRALAHDGSWEGFLSVLTLVPGCDLGLFLSVNGTSGVDAATDLMDGFFDRFAPAVPAAGEVSTSAAPSLPRAGFYEPARHNESTVEHLLVLLGSARLTVGGDGTVHFKGADWTPRDDGLYHKVGGTDRLSFRRGTRGERYVVTDGPSYQLLDRTETLPFNLVLLLAFAVAALSALAVPLKWRRAGPAWRWARALTGGSAVLGLGFLVGLGAMLSGDTSGYLYGAPASFRLLLAVPLIVFVAATAGAAGTVLGWRGAGVVARVHQVVLLGGLAAFGWFVWQWNLVGWWMA
jgi:CubicO group peptidase (beta-lactamase class C family)